MLLNKISQNHPMLTEAKIFAMSPSEYMSATQLDYFKTLLENQLADIETNMSHTSEHLREKEDAADPVDRATQEEVRGLELRARDRERKHIKTIESALRRIEDGTYGYCEETGEPIGIARLIARPTTKLSIEAQERHERRERQFSN